MFCGFQSLCNHCSLGEVVDGDVRFVGDGVEALDVLDPALALLPLLGVGPGQVRVVGPAAVEVGAEPRAVHAVNRPEYKINCFIQGDPSACTPWLKCSLVCLILPWPI